jgi:hypothetical protein
MNLRTFVLPAVCGVAVLGLWMFLRAELVAPPGNQIAATITPKPAKVPAAVSQPIEGSRGTDAVSQAPAASQGRADAPSPAAHPALLKVAVAEPTRERGGAPRQVLTSPAKPESMPVAGLQALQAIPPQPVDGGQAAPRAPLQDMPAQPLPPVSRTPYVPPQQPRDAAASAPQH